MTHRVLESIWRPFQQPATFFKNCVDVVIEALQGLARCEFTPNRPLGIVRDLGGDSFPFRDFRQGQHVLQLDTERLRLRVRRQFCRLPCRLPRRQIPGLAVELKLLGRFGEEFDQLPCGFLVP